MNDILRGLVIQLVVVNVLILATIYTSYWAFLLNVPLLWIMFKNR